MKRYLLLLALSGCMPQQAAQPSEGVVPKLVEGGVLEGRIYRASDLQIALPSAPSALARNGATLWVAYPFQLLRYQDGVLQASLPLPGRPQFMHAKPGLVMGIDNRLYIPSRGSLPYEAKDALNTQAGVLWIDSKTFYLERRVITEGSYSFIAGNEKLAYAFGRETVRFPDLLRIPLPALAKAAVVLDDLYILSDGGIYRLTLEGLQQGFRPGKFEGLESDGSRLYTLESGRLVQMNLNLDVVASLAVSYQLSRRQSRAISYQLSASNTGIDALTNGGLQ